MSLEAPHPLRRFWIVLSITLTVFASFVALTIGLALSLLSSDRKLHVACDRVVERLLTTHDPIELERSRILISEFDCAVSRRVRDWPPSRTGGLVP